MWSTFLQAFGLQHGIFRYFGLSRTQFPCTLHFRCFFWPSIARLWYRCSRSTIVCHTSSWLVHLVYFPVYCISSIIAVYPLPALLCHFLPSMTAISFDRYLALTLHLLYVAIITVNRVINFILLTFVFVFPALICFWFSKAELFKNHLVLCIALVFAIAGMVAIPFSYIGALQYCEDTKSRQGI